jgi:histidinol-phosphate aminotransferase
MTTPTAPAARPGVVTPVTFTSPVAPPGYTWEATSEAVAARYGLRLEDVLRFDLNTAPAPPSRALEALARGRFDVPLSEYPPSDYRRLAAAAAGAYGCSTEDLIVGAGADEVLDLCAKAFLRPRATAVVPVPTYPMYRILSEQRGATVVRVPRAGKAEAYGLNLDATRSAARGAEVVWLCDPNNPTGRLEPEGSIEALLEALALDAAADGRAAPTVVLDEAYAEFVGRSLSGLRARYRRLVAVRTASKAYALAGLRVGFGIARPELIAELAPYRPPGSVSVPSVAVVADALTDPVEMRANVTAVTAERARFAAALDEVGWSADPSVTNFLLVDLGTPERAAAAGESLLRRGLVPRTFPGSHPLAASLRLTVRTPADDDRLVEAVRAVGRALA